MRKFVAVVPAGKIGQGCRQQNGISVAGSEEEARANIDGNASLDKGSVSGTQMVHDACDLDQELPRKCDVDENGRLVSDGELPFHDLPIS